MLTLALFLATHIAGADAATQPARRLVEEVVDTSDRRVLPLADPARGPVNISFRLNLYQLLEVNEPKQFVTLNAWIGETWEDELVTWDPKKYAGIKSIIIPHYSIWLPKTILYNSLTMKDEDTRRLLNIHLRWVEGRTEAELLYPAIFTFSCHLNILFFPFDTQNCTLVFGSWTHDTSSIDYHIDGPSVGLSNYIQNEGWALIDFIGYRHTHNFSCCPDPYTNLHFHLIIQRKPLFYIVNLVIPTAIITLISLVGFFMPSAANGERSEKISLGITTLLSMSILLLMVSDQMPTTSNFIPLIGWFYLSMIGLISSGTIASSLVIIIQRQGRNGHAMSSQALRMGRLLSRLTFSSPLPSGARERYRPLPTRDDERRPRACPVDGPGWGGDELRQLAARLKGIGLTLDRLGEGIREREGRKGRREEWEWLASVTERAALLVFVLTQLIITLTILALGYSHSSAYQ